MKWVLKKNETIIIITLDYLLFILFQSGNEVSLQFINNKILTRLNLLLIDLQNYQNEEDNLENENNIWKNFFSFNKNDIKYK